MSRFFGVSIFILVLIVIFAVVAIVHDVNKSARCDERGGVMVKTTCIKKDAVIKL